jgi:hypothetical protein
MDLKTASCCCCDACPGGQRPAPASRRGTRLARMDGFGLLPAGGITEGMKRMRPLRGGNHHWLHPHQWVSGSNRRAVGSGCGGNQGRWEWTAAEPASNTRRVPTAPCPGPRFAPFLGRELPPSATGFVFPVSDCHRPMLPPSPWPGLPPAPRPSGWPSLACQGDTRSGAGYA